MKVSRRLQCALIFILLWGSNTLPALSESADGLFAANKFVQARSAYQAAIKGHPEQLEAHLGLLRTLFRLDLWQEAAAEANQLVVIAPQDGNAHGMLSLTLMRQGDPNRAAVEAKRALDLDPGGYWGLIAMGRVHVWNHEPQSAQSVLRRAIRLQPQWPEAWYGLLEASADDLTEQDLADSLTYLRLKPKGHPNTTMMETLATRIDFIRDFIADPPYVATAPIPEAKLSTAERGEKPDAVFTTQIARQDDYVILPITIGHQALNVLFDTGGGFELTLGKKAIDKLGLPALYKTIVRGVSGSEPSHLYKAKEMRVGEQTFRSIPIMGIGGEVGPFDGIFGVTNFDHYAVTIDFEHNTLTLARGKGAMAPAPAAGNRLVTTPFHYVGGDIFVPVQVEGRHVWAVVDSGADAYSIISLRLARELAANLKKGATREIRVNGRMGIGNSAMRQTVLGFQEPLTLTLGTDGIKPFLTKVQPAYGASPLDEQISPAGDFEVGALLGIGFLSTARRVTFDYPHGILTLEFPPQK